MRKVVSGLLAALFLLSVGLVAAAPSAQASDLWCDDGDPIVSIGGQTVSIQVGVFGDPANVRRSVHAADITIIVPEGTPTAVLSTSSNFFAESVHFVTMPGAGQGRAKKIDVTVRFDANANFPARVSINHGAADVGNTQGILHASMTLQ